MLASKVLEIEKILSSKYIGREEEARVLILALCSKQNALLVGPPGTAKSAMIRDLAKIVDMKFFQYLLTRYTTYDELFGYIDAIRFKNGEYIRNIENKLPAAEIVFLDELFRASSEILNSLLMLINERLFVDINGAVSKTPTWSVFSATNEFSTDNDLQALTDRFLIKHQVKSIKSDLLETAIVKNIENNNNNLEKVLTRSDLETLYINISKYMLENKNAISKAVVQITTLLRQNDIFLSDRTITSSEHFPRLVATYSYLYSVDPKRASVNVAKYLSIIEPETYQKIIEQLYPKELSIAYENVEKARALIKSGNLREAKNTLLETIQLAQSLLSKPEKLQLFKEDVVNILRDAENLIENITKIEAKLSEIARGD